MVPCPGGAGGTWHTVGVSYAPTDDYRDARVEPEHRSAFSSILRWIVRLVVGAIVMSLLVVSLTAFRVWQVARVDDETHADAIVVLGAAQYDGTPSSVFEARLEQALKLFQRGVAPAIITVGGKQAGDAYTEARAGRAYLSKAGVPVNNLVAVETGTDTLESMQAVKNEMDTRGMRSAVLVSDPWHMLRTRSIARDLGINAWTAPTRQGPAVITRESQLHGIIRETGALIWYHVAHSPTDFFTAPQ